MRTLKTEQKRKLLEELGCCATAILGVILLILNLLKIVPENNTLIAYFIAYGFILGPAMTLVGILGFFETRDIPVKEFRKRY